MSVPVFLMPLEPVYRLDPPGGQSLADRWHSVRGRQTKGWLALLSRTPGAPGPLPTQPFGTSVFSICKTEIKSSPLNLIGHLQGVRWSRSAPACPPHGALRLHAGGEMKTGRNLSSRFLPPVPGGETVSRLTWKCLF